LLVTAALVLVTVSEGVLLSIVPSTAAGIGQLLHVSPGSLNWINAVYLLSTGVCTLVLSRLGDIYGHRLVLRAAVLLTVVGGVLMAIASDFALLLVGRVLQGPAGAFTPLAIGILRSRADINGLRRGTAAVVTGVSAGVALGFLGSAQLYRATGSVRDVLWIPAACSGDGRGQRFRLRAWDQMSFPAANGLARRCQPERRACRPAARASQRSRLGLGFRPYRRRRDRQPRLPGGLGGG
jgi:MFS family permease